MKRTNLNDRLTLGMIKHNCSHSEKKITASKMLTFPVKMNRNGVAAVWPDTFNMVLLTP